MKRILMVTLSRHTSFQDGVFSMYRQLKEKKQYIPLTLTRLNQDYPVIKERNNYFVDAPEKPGLSKDAFSLKKLMLMMQVIRSVKADVVYFESFHLWNYPIMLYCKVKSIPVAHALHDVSIHAGDSFVRMKNILNLSVVLFSDRIVVRSKNGLENAVKKYPKHIEKIYRTDLWYTFPEYCPPRGNVMLFFGRMNIYKGLDCLYEIIRATPELDYVIAGKAEESVNSILDALGNLPNVTVINGVIPYNEMHEFFYSARCIVLPYRSATQSGVLLDAYKHSRPAVAFDVGALGEQIIDGETGYLVEPGDISTFVDRLRQLAEMPEAQYREICQRSYDYAIAAYSAAAQEVSFLTAIGAKET